MNKVFQKASDKHIQQATNNAEAEKETIEQQQAQSHILLATLEDAVNHFVAHSGEDLTLNQDTIRELHRQDPLCLEGQGLAAPHDSQ
ncbi:hypothetical protein Q4491_15785 [Photobacterium sp. 2_MG-2023]|uniref:hypothetical protein n=1 Tax=Photobacterium sp. 2_MG-2023 TaxID=3062663 RepID=UPI0026E18866|nr:hypothetical protein [Photobacterium sp. 2_MG-2023]MDO6582802.1 hypothetical protein [Photobacterium sp. 2_MG-2023]